MKRNSVTIKAAWIVFWGGIIVAIIGFIAHIFLNSFFDGNLSIDISLYEQSQIVETDSIKLKPLISYLEKINSDSSYYKPEAKLNYVYERNDNKIYIKPKMDYLNKLNEGKIITGIVSSLQCTYPIFSLKLVNNTDETQYFNQLVIETISSKLNKEPVLLISTKTIDEITIFNEGWGKILNPKISFSITDSNAYSYINSIKEPFEFSIQLKDFNSSLDIDLTNFEPSPVKTHSSYEPNNDDQLKRVEHLDKNYFDSKSVTVYGLLNYQNEYNEHKSFKFKTFAIVDRYYFDRHYPLSRFDPSALYAINLEAGILCNKKNISISHVIKPGDVDHFLLLLVSNKSAIYDLKFKFLTLENKEFNGNDVNIEFFVPRSNRYYFNDINEIKYTNN